MISTVVSQNRTIAITKFVISQKITKISADHKKLTAKLKDHKMKREPSFVYSKTEKELSEIKKELRQERMGRGGRARGLFLWSLRSAVCPKQTRKSRTDDDDGGGRRTQQAQGTMAATATTAAKRRRRVTATDEV